MKGGQSWAKSGLSQAQVEFFRRQRMVRQQVRESHSMISSHQAGRPLLAALEPNEDPERVPHLRDGAHRERESRRTALAACPDSYRGCARCSTTPTLRCSGSSSARPRNWNFCKVRNRRWICRSSIRWTRSDCRKNWPVWTGHRRIDHEAARQAPPCMV
jgi:hypothetical protein